jgi:hypothetical protein
MEQVLNGVPSQSPHEGSVSYQAKLCSESKDSPERPSRGYGMRRSDSFAGRRQQTISSSRFALKPPRSPAWR